MKIAPVKLKRAFDGAIFWAWRGIPLDFRDPRESRRFHRVAAEVTTL
jgi:hypothetical protein